MTSNGGLILVRELDEQLGLEKLIEERLSDSRQGLNKQFTLADLVWQSVYSPLAGYEHLNDAERLAADPTFRLISSQRIWDRGAALTKEESLIGLMALNRETVGQAESLDSSSRVVLDMDSSESPVHGEQEGSAYNGHFESVCYHPLFLFNSHGDCLRRSFVRAMCIAPKTGMSCCCRRSSVNRRRARQLLSERTRPLPNRISMKRWRSGA